MPTFNLSFSATLDNITNLKLTQPVILSLKLSCTACQNVYPHAVSIDSSNEQEIITGKGNTANLIIKCKECKKSATASVIPTVQPPKKGKAQDTTSAGIYTAEDSEKFKILATVECRGIEPIEWLLNMDSRFECIGLTEETKFNEIDLSDNEWSEYDERAGCGVSIMEVKTRIG